MAIAAQRLADQIRFALDAENAEHYGDNEDIIPAINSAIQWLTSVINASLGEKKFGEEIFRDLSFARVFRTSNHSRVSLDAFPDEPWTITAIYPKPITAATGASFNPPAEPKVSFVRPDLYHVSASNACKRLTIEQWSVNVGNPWSAGYKFNGTCDELTQYAYLDPIDYNPSNSFSVKREIEIRPAIVNDNVTIFYIKKPTLITSLANNIEFPDSVFSLLFNKSLSYIAYKQGDNTTLNTITAQDIGLLIQAIN